MTAGIAAERLRLKSHAGKEARQRARPRRGSAALLRPSRTPAGALSRGRRRRGVGLRASGAAAFPRVATARRQAARQVAAGEVRLVRGQVTKRPALSSWSSVLDYCRTAQAFADREQFRVLFLDKRNQLIADEVQQTGTVDHAPVYPREVVKRALELSATAIVLVHNHPSGDPTPSHADVQMTQQIIAVASPLGISVHDHIIVGKEGHASLKGLKLI